ncbi:hypothetical protein DF18_23090 [Streptomyces rimosus]|nr:hypothetical protein DF18_23090 [Streptomyces rimosus]KOT65349.1 hypothetical protein ADK44_07820 [Streptomyces rimosus subsp. rimosus]KOT68395.1 hypothetical protein ADK45_08015 [Streptomyces rimosus subsp. rimosus]KUJ26735.1 hypothetical protein ADK46_36940 [Streptomyces rimosus subsp. rimosus]
MGVVSVPVPIPEPDSGEGASSEGESPRRPSGVAPSSGVRTMSSPGGTGFVGERPSAGPAAPTAA